jgi:hypothetical protein
VHWAARPQETTEQPERRWHARQTMRTRAHGSRVQGDLSSFATLAMHLSRFLDTRPGFRHAARGLYRTRGLRGVDVVVVSRSWTRKRGVTGWHGGS